MWKSLFVERVSAFQTILIARSSASSPTRRPA
jgi:hypothetical protein